MPMPDAVKLVVPVDPAFRSLAVDLVRKYAELAGASPGQAQQVVDAVTRDLTAAAGNGVISASLAMERVAGGVTVRMEKSA